MDPNQLFDRYRELQSYVGWTDEDRRRVVAVGSLVEPVLDGLIDDFYAEIDRHPDARRVITGGAAQVERLRLTLRRWIGELFHGLYDADYVYRRWRVGGRHVEIGLNQVYTNVALSRMRNGLITAVQYRWTGDLEEQRSTVRAINKLLDLDLAIIEDAYQAEFAGRLQAAERLATLGQVAGGVAHELRNPLNVVKTSVYYLLNARSATPEKRVEHLQRIERHVGLADGVITALSNFAKMPVPNLHPIRLDELSREALEANPAGSAVAVELDFPPGLPAALADADQLRIVVGNLIRNARDAMPGGGRLALRGRAEGDEVELEVADSGVGIPPDLLKKVVEPLYSTKARGLGLGLAIARSILEKNRGRLSVRSDLGVGSTFTVRLNAAPAGTDGDGTP